ncbi:MAG TPA: hypothetical protein VHO70_05530 [Chitinispirillaceae bacterium]|nr:hypothetical protein [Chitinispirillaceae bacterium]
MIGTVAASGFAVFSGTLVYLALKNTTGIRLNRDQELRGSDLSVHHITAYPENEIRDSGLFYTNVEEDADEVSNRNNSAVKA